MEIFESLAVAFAAVVAAATFVFHVYQNFVANRAARADAFVKLHSEFLEKEKQAALMKELNEKSNYKLRNNDMLHLEEIIWFFERVAYLKAAGIIGTQEMNLFQPDLNLLANHETVKAKLADPSYRGYFPGFRRLAKCPDAGMPA